MRICFCLFLNTGLLKSKRGCHRTLPRVLVTPTSIVDWLISRDANQTQLQKTYIRPVIFRSMYSKLNDQTSILVDTLLFITSIGLIWGLEPVRKAPLELSFRTMDFIINGLSLQICNSGACILILIILGLVYTIAISTAVVLISRRIRENFI